MSSSTRFALILVCTLPCLYPGHATAEVHRCVTPDGQETFTDRECGDIGAVERVLPRVPAAGARLHGPTCARTVQDLVFELTAAIETHDTNRLAGVYHWAGMPGKAAYQTMGRLETIARRPLVDIAPLMPHPPAAPLDAGPGAGAPGSAPATPAAPASPIAAEDPDYYPQTSVRRTPLALRVEQTLGASATPVRTVFGLTRHLGCWWVRL